MDLCSFKGVSVEFEGITESEAARKAVAPLQKRVAYRYEVECGEAGGGDVVGPDIHRQRAFVNAYGCVKKHIEGLFHGVGLVPVDFANSAGADVGRNGVDERAVEPVFVCSVDEKGV